MGSARVSARVRQQVREAAESAWDGPPARVRIGEPVTGSLLEALAAEHEVWLEAGRPGEIVVRGPAGGRVSQVNVAVIGQIGSWSRDSVPGMGCDSRGGYDPPDGKPLVPQVSWMSEATLASLTEAQMRRAYWPVAPEFVFEAVGLDQSLAEQQEKARDWIAAGVRLALLISPDDELVELYWADGRVESFSRPDALSCDPVMPGFTLRFDEIWR